MISSNTVSNFTPCGCSSGKWGGMPRRGTIFQKVDDEVSWPFIPVDTGDVTQGATSDIQVLKDDYIFQAYNVLGYDVVNVGLSELRLGVDKLKQIGDTYNIKWVCSNIYSAGVFPELPITAVQPPTNPAVPPQSDPSSETDPEPSPTPPATGENPDPPENTGTENNETGTTEPVSTEPLFPPYVIVEPAEAPGFKIAFLGVMIQDAGRLNPLSTDFSFEPYQDAIRRNVDKLRNVEKVDLIVLLSDSDQFAPDFDTASIFEGVDIAVGGRSYIEPSPNSALNPLSTQFNEEQALNYMRESGQLTEEEGTQTETPETAENGQNGQSEIAKNIELQPLDLPLLVPKGQSRGRLVRRLDLFFNGSGKIVDYNTVEIRVDETNEDDPRMAEIALGYDTNVLSVELNNRVTRQFAGSQACEECHPGFIAAWADFGHFKSYDAVQTSTTPQDRECTRCHAIGFTDEPRLLTYELIPEQLRNVGCEGCHQRGYQHITLQNHLANLSPEDRGTVTTTDAMSTETLAATCQKCHSDYHEWSPEFNFEAAMETARGICMNVGNQTLPE
jgi:hypothetical protein